jgi:hypothetical protein
LKDIGIYGRIIRKWIFKKWGREICTGLICLTIRTVGRFM